MNATFPRFPVSPGMVPRRAALGRSEQPRGHGLRLGRQARRRRGRRGFGTTGKGRWESWRRMVKSLLPARNGDKTDVLMLVGGLEHFLFYHILGMSSSQLTFIFFRGVETTNQDVLMGLHGYLMGFHGYLMGIPSKTMMIKWVHWDFTGFWSWFTRDPGIPGKKWWWHDDFIGMS